MLDICDSGYNFQQWLEQAGDPVIETIYAPDPEIEAPYIVFFDVQSVGGADTNNNLIQHNLTILRYSVDGKPNEKLEELLDADAVHYSKERSWLSTENLYETSYTFDNPIFERRENV